MMMWTTIIYIYSFFNYGFYNTKWSKSSKLYKYKLLIIKTIVKMVKMVNQEKCYKFADLSLFSWFVGRGEAKFILYLQNIEKGLN